MSSSKQGCGYEVVGFSAEGLTVTLRQSRTKRGLKRSAQQVLRQHPEVETVAVNYRCPFDPVPNMQFACTRAGQQMRCHPVGTKQHKRITRRVDRMYRAIYQSKGSKGKQIARRLDQAPPERPDKSDPYGRGWLALERASGIKLTEKQASRLGTEVFRQIGINDYGQPLTEIGTQDDTDLLGSLRPWHWEEAFRRAFA